MNESAPFRAADLAELDACLLSRASAVVAMEDIAADARSRESDATIIGMRHDVDDNPGALEAACRLAEWEYERDYRSTYFLLHTTDYFNDDDLLATACEFLVAHGHEIGLHVNALAESIRTGRDAIDITLEAVNRLEQLGHPVHGVVAHGDRLCHVYRFVNDEMFIESARPAYGSATRSIGPGIPIRPVPRSTFGFDYDANWLPRGSYLSDSGGSWSTRWSDVVSTYGSNGQLHVLVHPDWWTQAFEKVAA